MRRNQLGQSRSNDFGKIMLCMMSAMGSWGILNPQLAAAEQSVESAASMEANLRQISPKRTVVTVDFSGGTRVSPGSKVTVIAGDSSYNGTVKKISSKGRGIIRLTAALPEAVETGTIAIKVNDVGSESDIVTVARGQGAGPFEDPGVLSGYDKAGFSGLAEVVITPMSGTTKVQGGSANEKVDFSSSSRDIGLDARARFLMGSFGGGLNLNAMNFSSENKASINTASTGTKDSDSISEKSSGYKATPNFAFVGNDGAYAIGLGWELTRLTGERIVKIASVEGPHKPVKTSENGLVVELSGAVASMKVGVNALLAGKGKLTEEGQKDIDRKRNGFGLSLIADAAGLKHRFAFDYVKFTDKYSSGNLESSKMGLDWQTQLSMASMNLVPRVAYDWENISFNNRKGKEMNLTVGSKVMFGAPMVGLELKSKNRTEDAVDSSPSYKTTMFGVAISGGILF